MYGHRYRSVCFCIGDNDQCYGMRLCLVFLYKVQMILTKSLLFRDPEMS